MDELIADFLASITVRTVRRPPYLFRPLQLTLSLNCSAHVQPNPISGKAQKKEKCQPKLDYARSHAHIANLLFLKTQSLTYSFRLFLI